MIELLHKNRKLSPEFLRSFCGISKNGLIFSEIFF